MIAPTKVEKGTTDKLGIESIRFIKTLSNGSIIVVEKEYKKSPDDMETITMWAESSAKASNAQSHRSSLEIDVPNAILDTDIAKIKSQRAGTKEDVYTLCCIQYNSRWI